MPLNMETIITAVQDTIELNAVPKDEIKAKIVDSAIVKNMLDSGGLMAIVMIPVLLLVIGVLGLLTCLAKKYPKVKAQAEAIKKTLFFGLIIQVMFTGLTPNCIASGMGKNLCFVCD